MDFSTKLCKLCGDFIHPMRIEALPSTTTCVKCSQENKKVAVMTHKVNREDIETSLQFYSAEQYRKIMEAEKKT